MFLTLSLVCFSFPCVFHSFSKFVRCPACRRSAADSPPLITILGVWGVFWGILEGILGYVEEYLGIFWKVFRGIFGRYLDGNMKVF